MREILFRGKRADNGEWVYGDLIHRYDFTFKKEEEYGNYSIKKVGGEEYEVIPETVCQYTGLDDKNGDKIFEGDKLLIGELLVCDEDVNGDGSELVNASIHTVIWGDDYPAFELYPSLGIDYNGLQHVTGGIDDIVCEIVGNIHDKEEL